MSGAGLARTASLEPSRRRRRRSHPALRRGVPATSISGAHSAVPRAGAAGPLAHRDPRGVGLTLFPLRRALPGGHESRVRTTMFDEATTFELPANAPWFEEFEEDEEEIMW